MLNAAISVTRQPARRPAVIRHREELSAVTDAHVRVQGYSSLREPDTPAFMRRLCGVSVVWPCLPPVEAQTPGPVTRLLETLFSCVLGDAFPMEETAGIRTCQ